MNKSIFTIVIMLLAFCGCHSSLKGRVGAAFSPGYTDGCLLNTRIYDSIKEVDSIYKVTSSDLAFLSNCLTKYRRDTKQRVTSPYMFIKMDSVLYILGHNRIVLTKHRTFSISQNEEYRIKCIFHYYDYQDDDFLLDLEEIRRFGVPASRHFKAINPMSPAKAFVKVILFEY